VTAQGFETLAPIKECQLMAVELISVHFPKAAGSAFLQSLQQAYGPDAVLCDNDDDPADPCGPCNLDPRGWRRHCRRLVVPDRIKVIHGHFHISKYAHMKNVTKITFLRHPVANLISIYYYWQTLPSGHGLFDYVRNHQLGILDLAQLPATRYLMSRVYFRGVDLDDFALVGSMENYSNDLNTLSRIVNKPLLEMRANGNRHADYQQNRDRILNNPRVVGQLTSYLHDDIRFYENAISRLGRHNAQLAA
jgi:hypothetical protein